MTCFDPLLTPEAANRWLACLIPLCVLGAIGMDITRKSFCRSYLVSEHGREFVFRTPRLLERLMLLWASLFGVATLGGFVALMVNRAYRAGAGIFWLGVLGDVLIGLFSLGALSLAMPKELRLDREHRKIRVRWLAAEMG